MQLHAGAHVKTESIPWAKPNAEALLNNAKPSRLNALGSNVQPKHNASEQRTEYAAETRLQS